MKRTGLVVIAIFAVAAVFYYLALAAAQDIAKSQQIEPQPVREADISGVLPKPLPAECVEGETKKCMLDNGCAGEIVCYGTRWSDCVAKRVCRPGRVAPCALNSCDFGLRTCNECGNGWSECTYPGE